MSDSGALIDLADAGCLHVLADLFEEVRIPEEVYREVFAARRAKPKFIKVYSATSPDALNAFVKMRVAVDDGEAAAIAVALELGVSVIIKDKAGMIQCERWRVPYMSLFRLLNERLPKSKCKYVVEQIRNKTGKALCEPDF